MFLEEYFEEKEIFYIFLLNRKTKETKQYYHTLESFKKYEKMLKNYNLNGWDVYYSINEFNKIEDKITRKENFVSGVKSLFFDIDENAETVVPNIKKSLGNPTFQVKTSENKYQLIYQFNNILKEDFEDFKDISRTLTYHFETDKTFDLSRVARLPVFENNKNGFLVVSAGFEVKYNLKHFKDFINNNNIEMVFDNKKVNTSIDNTKKKEKKEKPSYSMETINTNKSPYSFKYREFLSKNGGDYSAADMSLVVYLIKVRKLKNQKTIFKHFINTCPNLWERHNNIEEYFTSIFNKV